VNRRLFAFVVLAGLVAAGCSSKPIPPSGETPSGTAGSVSPGPSASQGNGGNPFGILTPLRLSLGTQLSLAKQLDVSYVRPGAAVFAESSDLNCSGCAQFTKDGFKLILTVRNGPDSIQQILGGGQLPASSFPKDLTAYKERIGQVIDLYHPTVLVIENEEDVPTHYSGTPEQYGEQLRVACEAAHQRDIKCTNGGLLSGSVTYAVYQHYVDTGQTAKAQSFAQRAFEDFQLAKLKTPGGSERIRSRVDIVRRFLAADGRAGADYINFHWYISDPQAMQEAVDYLSSVTGLPAMTNEMGQRNDDADATTRMMATVLKLGLPYAVWYITDAKLARGLINLDGSLRTTGDAFKQFIKSNV